MRFHVVALPHTTTSKEYNACAYTQKVLNFCKMMMELGHEVYHYGTEGSTVECTEHISITNKQIQKRFFGDYDWKKDFFKIEWDSNLPYWADHNARAIIEIQNRKKPNDFLCLISGHCQKPIADAVGKDMFVVEYGVGYSGVFSKFRVFESYAQMHKVYAMFEGEKADGKFYDAVIPNYFDPADFPFSEKKDDYLLYLGRLITRKGILVAVETAKALNLPLKIAGQGIKEYKPGRIVSDELTIKYDKLEYVGYADIKKRGELMSHARAVFVPTYYIEPFGGVAVEAMMCGTPVLTTDWGAFTETVQHGVTGYRCRTLDQFVWAAGNVQKLDYKKIRDLTIANYSIKKIGKMYQEYFNMIYDLRGKGWYNIKERHNLNWLTKKYG